MNSRNPEGKDNSRIDCSTLLAHFPNIQNTYIEYSYMLCTYLCLTPGCEVHKLHAINAVDQSMSNDEFNFIIPIYFCYVYTYVSSIHYTWNSFANNYLNGTFNLAITGCCWNTHKLSIMRVLVHVKLEEYHLHEQYCTNKASSSITDSRIMK